MLQFRFTQLYAGNDWNYSPFTLLTPAKTPRYQNCAIKIVCCNNC